MQKSLRVPSVDDKTALRAMLSDRLGAWGYRCRAAASDAYALITGESGTGKEVVERAIHESSSRRGGPFAAINAAALPEGLVESELFGHEKGAFTGAVQRASSARWEP